MYADRENMGHETYDYTSPKIVTKGLKKNLKAIPEHSIDLFAKQDRQYTCNVTHRRVRQSLLQWKRQ